MCKLFRFLLVVWCWCWVGVSGWGELPRIEMEGVDLLGPVEVSAIEVMGEGVTHQVVSVDGRDFREALSVNTLLKPAHHYQYQVILPSVGPVAKGDVLLVTFWARSTRTTDESGIGRLSVYFQKASKPWGKSIFRQVTLGDTWTFYSFPGVAKEHLAAGEASLGMGFGFLPQTVEVAGMRVRNFGRKVKAEDLPETVNPIVYPGMEAEAPWREQAAKRIEKHRKADMSIRVVDAAGMPVKGAQVSVRMKRHAYAFGSAVVAKNLAGDTEMDRAYQAIVEELYNKIVLENDLKFGPWRAGKGKWAKPTNTFYHPNLLKALDWLAKREIAIRGHTLMWGPVQENRYYRGLSFTEKPEEARAVLEAHLKEVLAETAGKVLEWDVLNHPVADFGDGGKRLDHIYGPEFYPEIVKSTRKLSPDCTLYVNEGSIMPRGNYRDAYEQHIASLVKAGAAAMKTAVKGHSVFYLSFTSTPYRF